jgi:hypothetical protein
MAERKPTKKAAPRFTAEERAAMRERATETKAAASGGQADGEADVLRRSPRCRSPIAPWPSGFMRS